MTPTNNAPDDLVERLRDLLAKATPGPWTLVRDKRTWGWVDVEGPSFCVGGPTRATDLTLKDEILRMTDAALIAQAPTLAATVIEQADRIAALEAQVAALTSKLQQQAEIMDYVLQDDLLNRMLPRVVDIAFTAWQSGRSGINSDDGGPCDWFTDTRPKVIERILEIRAALSSSPVAASRKQEAAP